jgi:DNA-binding NarL/FixJ family response regulator
VHETRGEPPRVQRCLGGMSRRRPLGRDRVEPEEPQSLRGTQGETVGDSLRNALWKAAAGEPVFSPALAWLVLTEFRRLKKVDSSEGGLSEREQEVLRYMARGLSYKEIGEELFISAKTVENHTRNILKKLHLSRKHELMRYAIERGIE